MVTDKQQKALVKAACQAQELAYAPYSKYKVGAAVLTEDGRIITGVNVENAVYGLTICAERAAVFTAVGQGVRKILAIANCTANAGSPCGACRQVLSEFASDILILMSDRKGDVRANKLHTLLPDFFTPDHLRSG
jgi:cytidine deaminase